MKNTLPYFIDYKNISDQSKDIVGSKNFSLKKLNDIGVPTPQTIALTTHLFHAYMEYNQISFDYRDYQNNPSLTSQARTNVLHGIFSEEQQLELKKLYQKFAGKPLAVRSSSTFEDLHDASFSGQYDSFIYILSEKQMIDSIKKCYASIFSERVFSYIETKKITIKKLAMGVVIQETIDSQVSGVVFTIDPLSKSDSILYIETNYGFGESIVGGEINTDKWFVCKKNNLLVKKILGTKKYQYKTKNNGGLKKELIKNLTYSLTDTQVTRISELSQSIEKQFKGPQDIEFAIDKKGDIIILQARPQIVDMNRYTTISTLIDKQQRPVGTGVAVVKGIATGVVTTNKKNAKDNIFAAERLEVYDIPALKNAAGLLITDIGLGSHAASVIREYKIPTIINPSIAFSELTSKRVTIDTTTDPSKIYLGKLAFKTKKVYFDTMQKTNVPAFVGCSNASMLHELLHAPIDGIGLVRSEFIINSEVGIHPLALLDYDAGKLEPKLRNKISKAISGYESASDFFRTKLVNELSMIMALMPGKVVNYRLCDFQSNSYSGLIGGENYEKYEENPMMGFRGTTRLISEKYEPILQLETEALTLVSKKGLGELRLLAPFCRLPEDGILLRKKLKKMGITNKVGMMVELSSNILLAKEFAKIFDFFFVGPRDLTQNLHATDRSLPELHRYKIDCILTKQAVMHFLKNIEGQKKEVFIALFDLYKHIEEFNTIKSNNTLTFSGSPSSILSDIKRIAALEKHK